MWMQAAASKTKIKYKPLIDEEDERRRASAAAKLRALDEAIAKRRAEEERYISSFLGMQLAHDAQLAEAFFAATLSVFAAYVMCQNKDNCLSCKPFKLRLKLPCFPACLVVDVQTTIQ